MILQTAEFWVAVAFAMAVVIALKLIVPKVVAALTGEQSAVIKKFDDAEKILALAEKKYAEAKESLDTLDQQIEVLETEFDKRVSDVLNRWSVSKEELLQKKGAVHKKSLEHAANHMHVRFLNSLVDLSCDALEETLQQLVSSRNHSMVLNHNLQTLKLMK